jgi:hypothetical protein
MTVSHTYTQEISDSGDLEAYLVGVDIYIIEEESI